MEKRSEEKREKKIGYVENINVLVYQLQRSKSDTPKYVVQAPLYLAPNWINSAS